MSVLDWRLHPTKGHGVIYWLTMKAIVDGQAREKANRRPSSSQSSSRVAGSQHTVEAGTRERNGSSGSIISDPSWDAFIY